MNKEYTELQRPHKNTNKQHMNKEYPVGNMNKQYMKISTKSTWTYRQKAHKKSEQRTHENVCKEQMQI